MDLKGILRQTHLTLEQTFGFSPDFAMGFMFLNAWESGYDRNSPAGAC